MPKYTIQLAKRHAHDIRVANHNSRTTQAECLLAPVHVCVSVFGRWDSSVECTMRVAVTLSLRLRRWRIRQPHVERCQMRQSQTSLWWHGLAAATLIYAPRAFVCATPVTIMCSRRLVKASVVEWQSLKKQDKRIYSASRNKSNRSTK